MYFFQLDKINFFFYLNFKFIELEFFFVNFWFQTDGNFSKLTYLATVNYFHWLAPPCHGVGVHTARSTNAERIICFPGNRGIQRSIAVFFFGENSIILSPKIIFTTGT